MLAIISETQRKSTYKRNREKNQGDIPAQIGFGASTQSSLFGCIHSCGYLREDWEIVMPTDPIYRLI